MSISTKDLRDIFDEATKRAADAIGDAKLPEIGRRDTTPGFVLFSLGLLMGALVGVVIAFLTTPLNGEQARRRLSEQVEKVRQPHPDYDDLSTIESTNGTTVGSATSFDR